MEKAITIKNEDGVLMPYAYLWKDDHTFKYHQPEINKILKKMKDWKLARVQIEETI